MTKDDGEMVEEQKKKPCRFWIWALSSVLFRLILISYAGNLNLSSRPEVSTPLTSIRRLAEGYWLKQASMSPYAGSMYHGSPLLLSLLGPLTVQRIKGQPSHLFCSLVFVIADILSAILLRGIGKKLQMAYGLNARLLGLLKSPRDKGILPCGDIAALVYLWNPFTIVCCVGLSTSPIENLAVILALNGAVTRRVPLAAFGLVMATHLSLYPAILTIPVCNLSIGIWFGCSSSKIVPSDQKCRKWLSLSKHGGLEEMFKRTYGFILSIEDLSPNIGVFWYFFAEVFDFFRNFFLIVFHVNILFMLLPLAIRLKHRPCFLAFIYLAISSLLKSYPSVGDSALYLSLWALFVNELADMKFSFFLFCGYLGVSLLSPVMHNLWIWRGTGNANFYFGNAIGYACFQIVFVVESVSAMLNHDRALKKCNPNHQKVKN
ncbi:hypothetical protein YC2023_114858 [Brassica napus]